MDNKHDFLSLEEQLAEALTQTTEIDAPELNNDLDKRDYTSIGKAPPTIQHLTLLYFTLDEKLQEYIDLGKAETDPPVQDLLMRLNVVCDILDGLLILKYLSFYNKHMSNLDIIDISSNWEIIVYRESENNKSTTLERVSDLKPH